MVRRWLKACSVSSHKICGPAANTSSPELGRVVYHIDD